MSANLVGKAFEAGVKAALKFFSSAGGGREAAKAADTVMKTMKKAVKVAATIKK